MGAHAGAASRRRGGRRRRTRDREGGPAAGQRKSRAWLQGPARREAVRRPARGGTRSAPAAAGADCVGRSSESDQSVCHPSHENRTDTAPHALQVRSIRRSRRVPHSTSSLDLVPRPRHPVTSLRHDTQSRPSASSPSHIPPPRRPVTSLRHIPFHVYTRHVLPSRTWVTCLRPIRPQPLVGAARPCPRPCRPTLN